MFEPGGFPSTEHRYRAGDSFYAEKTAYTDGHDWRLPTLVRCLAHRPSLATTFLKNMVPYDRHPAADDPSLAMPVPPVFSAVLTNRPDVLRALIDAKATADYVWLCANDDDDDDNSRLPVPGSFATAQQHQAAATHTGQPDPDFGAARYRSVLAYACRNKRGSPLVVALLLEAKACPQRCNPL